MKTRVSWLVSVCIVHIENITSKSLTGTCDIAAFVEIFHTTEGDAAVLALDVLARTSSLSEFMTSLGGTAPLIPTGSEEGGWTLQLTG